MRKNIGETILELMGEAAYKNLGMEELTGIFAQNPSDKKEVERIINKLVDSGEIFKSKKNKFGLPEKNGFAKGILKVNPKGFAFLLCEDGDVFIPPSKLATGMEGDEVLAKITGEKTESTSREGEVVRIINRGTTKIVGEFYDNINFGFVVPSDVRLKHDVFIPKAKTAGAKKGDVVVCKLTRYPSEGKKPEGEIIQILGKKNKLDVEIEGEIIQKNIRHEFDKKVMSYVDGLDGKITENDISSRLDLRDILIFTIDGEDAKDLDDAISIKRIDDGYELGVHIADVTHYVKEYSPVDKEALKRGTSVYFPDRVIPMLPKKLSNELCSLNPNEGKLTLSCIMTLDKNGKIKSYNIAETIIESRHRLVYTDVTKFIENPEEVGDILSRKDEELNEALRISYELSLILEQNKHKRGNIDFDFPEAKFQIQDDEVLDVIPREMGIANKIIEEFMILTNEVVAEAYFIQEIPFLYRVHEEPDEEKLSSIFSYLSRINIKVPHRRDGKIYPKDLQMIIEETKELDQHTIISYALLRSLKKAKYSPEPIGHFGLASKYYSHFTSPIRRYPDLQIHRIIKENINGKLSEKRIAHYEGVLADVADISSDREVSAMEIERNVDDLLKCHYMERHIGEEMTGIIISVTNFGMFIMFENTIEGLVKFADVKTDYFQYDQDSYCARGERTGKVYSIGDKIPVIIDSIDYSFREVRLALAKV